MRIGVLRITEELVKTKPSQILKLWSAIDFVPTKIQHEFWSGDVMLYFGISEYFMEIPEGGHAPEYTITYDRETDTYELRSGGFVWTSK